MNPNEKDLKHSFFWITRFLLIFQYSIMFYIECKSFKVSCYYLVSSSKFHAWSSLLLSKLFSCPQWTNWSNQINKDRLKKDGWLFVEGADLLSRRGFPLIVWLFSSFKFSFFKLPADDEPLTLAPFDDGIELGMSEKV